MHLWPGFSKRHVLKSCTRSSSLMISQDSIDDCFTREPPTRDLFIPELRLSIFFLTVCLYRSCSKSLRDSSLGLFPSNTLISNSYFAKGAGPRRGIRSIERRTRSLCHHTTMTCYFGTSIHRRSHEGQRKGAWAHNAKFLQDGKSRTVRFVFLTFRRFCLPLAGSSIMHFSAMKRGGLRE
jgi:hypothetical protein